MYNNSITKMDIFDLIKKIKNTRNKLKFTNGRFGLGVINPSSKLCISTNIIK